jgi:hypothetical protein
MADIRRLVDATIPPDLAREIGAQIDTATGNRRRLVELGMVPVIAAEVAAQIGGTASALRLIELGMSPATARQLSVAIGGGGTPPVAGAAFTMTQLADQNRIYQRTTDTGGGQGKGTGSIAVPVNVTNLGAPFFRIRASDGTTILQASTALPAFTTTGAQTLTVPGVDARLGWFYLDLSADGTTWQSGTTLVGMGANIIVSGQSLASRMLTSTDSVSMASVGVTPDPNTSTYVLPGDGGTPQTVLAWRLWDGTSVVGSGQAINSAGGAQMAKTLVAQLGVNVGTIGHPVGGTPIVTHTMAGSNGASIRQIIQDAGGFEYSFLMIGHTNAQGLTTGGIGARDFKGTLSVFFQTIAAANPRGTNFKSVVWAIPNIVSASFGTETQRNEIRRAMYEFARSPTMAALTTASRYVNSYSITLSGDNVHQGQAGAVQIANIVTTAWISGADATAGDDTLTATPLSPGTPTNATYSTAGKFQAAALNGGYVVVGAVNALGGVSSTGFWYQGTPANGSVAISYGNSYLIAAGGRWRWHAATGTDTTPSTGPLIGTDSTTWHYVGMDLVPNPIDGSAARVLVHQDGVVLHDLTTPLVGPNSVQTPGAIRTYGGSPANAAFNMGVPVSDWRTYTKAMGVYVPTAALTANEPFLFQAFPLNGDGTAVV